MWGDPRCDGSSSGYCKTLQGSRNAAPRSQFVRQIQPVHGKSSLCTANLSRARPIQPHQPRASSLKISEAGKRQATSLRSMAHPLG